MTYQPAHYPPIAPVFISPWSWNSIGPMLRAAGASTPVSSTNAGGRAYYTPFYLPAPYDLQRFFWQNGATVGTDSIQAAVYSVDGSNVMDCVVSTARTLSAGTVNHLQFATCSVVAHSITSGSSTTDGTSFATASVTLKARPGLMYALAFINSKASAAEVATTVQTTTGGTIAFTSRNSQTYGASTEGRVSLWTAVPSSDVTDTITISFSGTQTGCAWALVAFTNVDTTTDHGIVQTAVGSGNSTTPLATLGAFGSSNNATLGLNANLADTTTTAGTGFLEIYDVNYATPTNCLQVQYTSANDTTSDGTITSGQWGALAAEVKSLGTTAILAPGRYYLAMSCSGTTATFFRVSSSSLVAQSGIYTEALSLGMPLTATPTNTLNTVVVVHGITNRASP